MKKILKYFLWLFAILLLVVCTGIFAVYLRYQVTVSKTPGQLQVAFQPGEMGKWVNPFIGTGGFPSYTSSDDIPGVTVPFGMVRLSPDTRFSIGKDFFEKAAPERGTWNPGLYYWHGNEPDIYAAYLFNSAGRPDLTQKWVRMILENKYGADYDGMDGYKDAGILSAWYVFSALGV